jgi:hypothetical protein
LQITISYMPVADEGSDLREVRQDYLREWYGFQCACAECTLQVQGTNWGVVFSVNVNVR